ncbi:hypothetical protein [Helicovermis profundi]|uniref:Uncharacterized protein n=1 Tax=Helicovermis profundi TaxID=3065157 RepID=A0AAU9EG69_9FIRM|nr:hypothetical protein HLPR_20930 [Clostridia bacterium S502]
MLNIKKIEKTNSNITKYKKKNTISYQGATSVEKVTPIKPAFNNNKMPNNELINQIYSNFKKLKKEYKDFFNNEQILESNIKMLFDNSNEEEFIKILCRLLNTYNDSVDSLYAFDKIFETEYNLTIKEIVYKYEDDFIKLSIFIEPDAKLRYYKSKLKKIYTTNNSLFNFLCLDNNSFFQKLYLAFSTIKSVIPLDTDNKIFDKNINGFLVDEKC